MTKTKLTKRLWENTEKEVRSAKRHPLNKIGNKYDLTHGILFLLRNESKWITGQTL